MSNLHPQFKLVHLGNTDDLNFNVGMEIAAVSWILNEELKFLFQGIDIVESSVKVDEQVDLFPHILAASDVLYPQVVQDDVGNLNHLSVLDALEYRV